MYLCPVLHHFFSKYNSCHPASMAALIGKLDQKNCIFDYFCGQWQYPRDAWTWRVMPAEPAGDDSQDPYDPSNISRSAHAINSMPK